ncbi:hypothetical protein RHI42_02890 [Clostridioides difficile]|nr:hypothetical protein [Clostridioides difficile]
MEIRYAKEEDIESIKEIWSYCFNDTESFMKYYLMININLKIL